MNHKQDSVNFKLVDDFLKDLAELKQAFDDKTWQFNLCWVVLVSSQKVEEDAEN